MTPEQTPELTPELTPENPFPADPDRAEIWAMLVERDIAAYVRADWTMVEADYVGAAEFVSLDAGKRSNPDSWRIGGGLAAHGGRWLADSEALVGAVAPDQLTADLYDATTLRDIDISDGAAVAHKKLDGTIHRRDGGTVRLDWQTLYLCRRDADRWRISGVVGHLPHPVAERGAERRAVAAKELPADVSQHVTAGPYSPVLVARADRWVVISGQAAIAPDGSVVGSDIEEQTRLTLENCQRQLSSAGCTLADVVKVNAYLSDMALWPRFNAVYQSYLPEPRPVRTVVGAALLPGLLVEVELWAATK